MDSELFSLRKVICFLGPRAQAKNANKLQEQVSKNEMELRNTLGPTFLCSMDCVLCIQ